MKIKRDNPLKNLLKNYFISSVGCKEDILKNVGNQTV